MSADKTEQPTPKRLRDARKKGQVAKSQEVSSVSVLLAVILFLWAGWGYVYAHLEALVTMPMDAMDQPFAEALPRVLAHSFEQFAYLAIPAVVIGAVAGLAGNLAQIGFLVSTEAVTPKLDKLHPKNWFNKVFAWKNALEFVKTLLKIVLIVVVFRAAVATALEDLALMPYHSPADALALIGHVLMRIVLYCGALFIAVAAADYVLQRHLFLKEMMMSKAEVKQEYKEMEGDPTIKSQRRQLHQEMAMNDAMAGVRESSVLVTNPTHIAIGLRYEKDETPLPVITAKGEGAIAKRMMEVAEEEGIPIMRNVPLARDLWEKAEVEHYIPSDLIDPVAEVLRWVAEMKQ